jgi:Spy/CpxP family protein refolding chaperone
MSSERRNGMKSLSFVRSSMGILALGLGTLGVCSGPAIAADAGTSTAPAGQKTEAKKADGKAAEAKPAEKGNRLPPYYRQVVSNEQRQQIYKILTEYAPKVDQAKADLNKAVNDAKAKTAEFKTQLSKLTKEQTDKIEALLTPEQKAKLAQLKAAAEAKRQATLKKKADEKKKAETKAPAEAKAPVVKAQETPPRKTEVPK